MNSGSMSSFRSAVQGTGADVGGERDEDKPAQAMTLLEKARATAGASPHGDLIRDLANSLELAQMRIRRHENLEATVVDLAEKSPTFVWLPDGRRVPVLGDLPLTQDGCLIGHGATLHGYHPDGTRGATATSVVMVRSEEDEVDWDLVVGGIWSTAEAVPEKEIVTPAPMPVEPEVDDPGLDNRPSRDVIDG